MRELSMWQSSQTLHWGPCYHAASFYILTGESGEQVPTSARETFLYMRTGKETSGNSAMLAARLDSAGGAAPRMS